MKTQQSANTNRGRIDCDSCPMLGDMVTHLIPVSVINRELEELVNDGLNYKDPKVTKFLGH